MANDTNPSKWVVNLSGSEWGTVKYGVVEYLRARPKMRVTTAVIGLLWVVGWIISTAGFKWQNTLFPAISTFFVTPTLLWFAVVSGPDFRLTFPEPKTPDQPATSPADTKGIVDAEGYGIESLNKSYASTEAYGRSAFRWAMFALVAGIATASGNAWMITSRASIVGLNHTSLFIWILAATLLLICVILLVRSMSIFRRAAVIHDRLLDLQKTITAIKYLERSHDTTTSIDPSLVIARLLSQSGGSNEPNS